MSEFFTYSAIHEKHFIEHGERLDVKKGHPIVWDNTKVPWVFFLQKGRMKLALPTVSGPSSILGYMIPGMTFAQPGAYFEPISEGVIYEAVMPSTLYRIEIETFYTELDHNHELAKEWLWGVLKNQKAMVERIAYQGERGIRARVIRWLLFMAKYYGDTKGNSCEIYIPLTQEVIGQFVNATRESINKTLSEIIKSGLITIEKKQITIVDIEKLKKTLLTLD